MLGSQGPPHLCASASTVGKQDVYLEGPGQLLAIERLQRARCSDIPLSSWPGSHSPSPSTLQVFWVCVRRVQFPRGPSQTQRILGPGEEPRGQGWEDAEILVLRKGTLFLQSVPGSAGLLENKPFAKGVEKV